MNFILLILILFLDLIKYIILLDVILSWLQLLGIQFRPKFIQAITIPLYEIIRKYIPSSFSGIDFAPIIVYIIIGVLQGVFLTMDPSIMNSLPKI